MNLKKYAPIVIRIGISLVFLWFGIYQLINPESFLGYVPQAIYEHSIEMSHEHSLQFFHNIPKPSIHVLIMGNGIFEVIFGGLLLIGLFTRVSALLLSLHLAVIMFSIGYNDIGVRDFGLFMATLSVLFYGMDEWCLDKKLK